MTWPDKRSKTEEVTECTSGKPLLTSLNGGVPAAGDLMGSSVVFVTMML